MLKQCISNLISRCWRSPDVRPLALLGMTGVFLLLNCGPQDPKPEKQSSTQIRQPDWSSPNSVFAFKEDGLKLAGDNKPYAFEGSLTIWDENADPKKVAQILELYEKSKDARNSYLREIAPVEGYQNEIIAAKKQLEIEQEKSRQLQKNSFYKDHRDENFQNSLAWAAKQIRQGKETEFENFCDIELLKFASSDFLMDNVFASRPEPLAICSEIYKKKGMFASSFCTQNTDVNPGNYMRCIWEDGVLRSYTLFMGVTTKANAMQVAEFLKQFDIVKVFLKDSYARFLLGNKIAENYSIRWNKRHIKFNVLFERTSKEFTDNLDVQKEFSALTELRISTKDKKKFTFNDKIFNFHLLKNETDEPQLDEVQKSDLQKSQESNSQIFGKVPSFVDPTKDERDRLTQLISDLSDKIHNAGVVHRSAFIDLDGKSANIMVENHLAKALLSKFQLKMTPHENQIHVKMFIDPTAKSIVGCFDWTSGKQEACIPEHADSETCILSFDKTSGLLSVNYTIANPELIGFKEKQEMDENFNFQKIPQIELTPSTMLIEIYPRQYKEFLDAFSGTVKIQSKSALYQGSVSLVTKTSQI